MLIDSFKEKMRSADVVLYLFDVAEMSSTELSDVVKTFEEVQLNYFLVGK